MNVGAIDIGTNSVRMLITDTSGAEIARHMQITRLGQDVDRRGRLVEPAIARTLAVLRRYRETLDRHGVARIRAIATSAARDADNRRSFFARVEATLGHPPELISGSEEAELSFIGATAELDPGDGPFLIFDIGGGSTEFVLGTRLPESLLSVDIGTVRLSERHLASDPPRAAELRACIAEVSRSLEAVRTHIAVGRARLVIGLAGTVAALAAMKLGLAEIDRARTHGMILRREDVESLLETLAAVDMEARRRLLLEPERARVIVAGAAILLQILRDFDTAEMRVSEHDILDGLAASIR